MIIIALIALLVGVAVVAFIIVKIMVIIALAVLGAIYFGSYYLVSTSLLPGVDLGWQLLAAGCLGTGICTLLHYLIMRDETQQKTKKAKQKVWWEGIKTPRYQPCPCGSGKPFSDCHERMSQQHHVE